MTSDIFLSDPTHRWERGHLEYGLYLDALYLDAKKRQQAGSSNAKQGSGRAADRLNGQSRVILGEERAYYELLPEVLKSYGRAVELGSGPNAHVPHLPLLEHLVLLAAHACMPPEPDA